MSYQVLARKWRPRTFDDLVGQDLMRQALSHALTQNHLHHAYLFTGTRGIGKTTLARILAKCLLCEQGISARPCQVCETCTNIDAGRCIDFIEVDAASRTKVEETRDLLDNVQYMPVQTRFKIYLIDEVHMLSTHSFNALLKTLEEPPSHVKFILATTDPQKLPVTVLSRCLQFPLRPFTAGQIQTQLEKILSAEQITFTPSAIDIISQSAEGSLRDGLSLLEQAIAVGQGAVDFESTQAMLGLTPEKHAFELIEYVIQHQPKELLAAIGRFDQDGIDFLGLLKSCLNLLHRLATLPWSPAESSPQLSKLYHTTHPEMIQLYYQIALDGSRDLQWAPDPQTGFEMTLLRMVAFQPLTLSDNAPPSPNPKSKIKPHERVDSETAKFQQEDLEPRVEQAPPVLKTAAVKPSQDIQESAYEPEQWGVLVSELGLDPLAKQLAKQCILKAMSGDHFQLQLSQSQSPLLNERVKERLRQALENHQNKPIKVTIELHQALSHSTPAEVDVKRLSESHQEIHKASLEDPFVKIMVEQFDAKIDKIEPK